MAAQADGSVVVAGVAGDRWSVARFLPTGATDGLFGAAGVTLRDPTPGGSAEEEEFYPGEEPTLPDGTGPAAIAIAPSGQLVVAGSVGVANDDGIPSEQIVVARFNGNGLPDPTFGRDGFAVLQLGFGGTVRHAASTARGLALLPDGRVLIAGRASARDGGDRAFVARLMAGGAPGPRLRPRRPLARPVRPRVVGPRRELVARLAGAAARRPDRRGGPGDGRRRQPCRAARGLHRGGRAGRRVRAPRQRRLAARSRVRAGGPGVAGAARSR